MEKVTLDTALRDLKVTLDLLSERLDPFFEGEVHPDDRRSMESKVKSVRRILLGAVNAIADVYGPLDDLNISVRASISYEIVTDELEKYGIVPMPGDGTLFTFKKDEVDKSADRDA